MLRARQRYQKKSCTTHYPDGTDDAEHSYGNAGCASGWLHARCDLQVNIS